MRRIIKNFLFTFYAIIFLLLFFLFTKLNPDINNGGATSLFWNLMMIIFFPMIVAVKNGGIFKAIIYLISIDILIIYLRKKLIPFIKLKLSNKKD